MVHSRRYVSNLEADGRERSDFPIVCESCLGDNPYVRMTSADFDKECKTCSRPFTVFRWKPGRDARYKKTEICQTCSKMKNVCQVCVLDIQYGLPVQVLDSTNPKDAVMPMSDVNREYFAEEHDRRARASGIIDQYEQEYGKSRPSDTILKLQRTAPYYQRNRAHVCSFYVRGECKRGAECPYRHEMPITGELSNQNIKNRYHGVDDPVALKLLRRAGEMGCPEPPEDESIRTLYVGGVVDGRVSEQDLRDCFWVHGEIESIRMVVQRGCAFVTYATRQGAEKAAEDLCNKLVIKGLRLKLAWGRQRMQDDEASRQPEVAAPAHCGAHQHYYMPPPPSQERTIFYPSMDPQRMGALVGRT
ncbi:hypothetical protein M0R45_035399 [Rubus argutus]|uniref:Uncharacterized protein n=1 Tax=Rubus argutus TaxID=59490 RepID=A0AAW1VU43_RUBAR